jgi:TRAP-type C4-dicarboxylate transport system permease small subunit
MIEPILRGYCIGIRYVVDFIGRSVAYLLPVLSAIVAFEVFARYVLDRPTIWAYDTSLFLFGYIAALGGARAQHKDAHINVDIVHGKVSDNVRRIFDLISVVLAIGFLVIMAKTCFGMFLEALEFHYKTQSEWAPATHHFWLMITIASSIFVLQYSTEFICNLFHLVTNRDLLADSAAENDLSEPPFKVDSHQLTKPIHDKESPNGN